MILQNMSRRYIVGLDQNSMSVLINGSHAFPCQKIKKKGEENLIAGLIIKDKKKKSKQITYIAG